MYVVMVKNVSTQVVLFQPLYTFFVIVSSNLPRTPSVTGVYVNTG